MGVEVKTRGVQAFKLQDVAKTAGAEELSKSSAFAAVVDLRNANAGGIAFANRQRIVEAFSEPGKPGDTGRPEVQGRTQYALCCRVL